MTFTISGRLRPRPGVPGRAATATWRSPTDRRSTPVGAPVDGDPALLAALDALAGRELDVSPTGPAILVDLEDPASVLVALAGELDDGYELSGTVPRLPIRVPRGAIA